MEISLLVNGDRKVPQEEDSSYLISSSCLGQNPSFKSYSGPFTMEGGGIQ